MSAATAAAAAAVNSQRCHSSSSSNRSGSIPMMDSTYYGATTQPIASRYEFQKQRDWKTFDQYRRNLKPVPLSLPKCGSKHVLEFLRYLDRSGETNQSWGSLDALVDRLRVAFEENGGRPETNPFGAPDVRSYLRQVRDYQK